MSIMWFRRRAKASVTGPRAGPAEPATGGRTVTRTPQRTVLSDGHHLAAVSDTGRVREHNEDAFHVADDGHWWVVADGMGGHAAGEVASAVAVETVRDHLSSPAATPDGKTDAEAEAVLTAAMDAAHARVLAAASERREREGMGCTLVVAWLRRAHLHVCHVGDVRCYLLSAGRLRQVTADHSVVGLLVEQGELTGEEARLHPRKNEILQAVGMPGGIDPGITTVTLSRDDRVLMCSDGLWDELPDNDIREILASDGSMRQLAVQLTDRAIEAGGRDNITVVVYEHGETEVVNGSA